ncbi:MAG: non-specific endonuclease [Pedosphaera sp.]|nr:non-specific endonuclease [Pedosphaera sp.]
MKPNIQKSSLRNLVPLLISASALFLAVLQAGATISTSLQLQLGNPSNAAVDANNHDHYLIQRTVESLDFSDNLGAPNWASWDLTSGDVGSSGRSASFYTDTNLPAAFYHVTTSDYTSSGYDRGHMCPSDDRTDNTTDNKLVFFMSNIIPQAPDNNQGPWASFESYCRTLASAGDEILIMCGPSLFDGSRIQPSGKVSIPGYTWKIAVDVPAGSGSALSRITASTRVIALKLPNIAGIRSTPWTNFITSANQIQTDTGYTFFTALPASVAGVLRAKVDGAAAPTLSSFSPASGAVGASVTVNGTGFTTAASVTFNGTSAAFTINSDVKITATVPTGTTTGKITVAAGGGSVTSASTFTVSGGTVPGITSFSPTSGAVGTGITLTGVNFTSASSVKFNGTSASYTVNSSTSITTTVPAGATTGPISVTTQGGTATSSTSFTVTSGGGSGTVVISQVYGGGGNSGATYKNDFIELYNAGSTTVDLSTYAVQYASAAGTSWQETTLSGSLLPGHYYLVQEAAGTGGTLNLPTPEAIGTISMSASSAKVALTKTQTLLTVDNPVGLSAVADFVGYGTADAFEGTGAAPTLSATTSALRANGGSTDTTNNAADFTAGTVNPRN